MVDRRTRVGAWKRMFAFVLASGALVWSLCPSTVFAQFEAGTVCLMAQGTAGTGEVSGYYHSVDGTGSSTDKIVEVSASVIPMIWVSRNVAFEVECGILYNKTTPISRVPTPTPQYREFETTELAFLFIPHLVLAAPVIDSTLAVYVRGGVGLSTHYSAPLVTVIGEELGADLFGSVVSLGAGFLYVAGPQLVLRAELSSRNHYAEAGSHAFSSREKSTIHIYLGVGIRL